jgi:hypothetical protein
VSELKQEDRFATHIVDHDSYPKEENEVIISGGGGIAGCTGWAMVGSVVGTYHMKHERDIKTS